MVLFFSVMVIALFAAGGGEAGEKGQLDILKSSCTSCHGLSRTCNLVGNADKVEWLVVLERMNRHGSNLSSSEMDELAGYLADPQEELKTECN